MNPPTPFFPASGPANRSFNGLHPKSKFLAIPFMAMSLGEHNVPVLIPFVVVLLTLPLFLKANGITIALHALALAIWAFVGFSAGAMLYA